MAAFQVSTNGRFWVSTEVELDASRALAIHIFGFWLIRGMSVRDAGYGAETLAREVFEAAREADDQAAAAAAAAVDAHVTSRGITEGADNADKLRAELRAAVLDAMEHVVARAAAVMHVPEGTTKH